MVWSKKQFLKSNASKQATFITLCKTNGCVVSLIFTGALWSHQRNNKKQSNKQQNSQRMLQFGSFILKFCANVYKTIRKQLDNLRKLHWIGADNWGFPVYSRVIVLLSIKGPWFWSAYLCSNSVQFRLKNLNQQTLITKSLASFWSFQQSKNSCSSNPATLYSVTFRITFADQREI